MLVQRFSIIAALRLYYGKDLRFFVVRVIDSITFEQFGDENF